MAAGTVHELRSSWAQSLASVHPVDEEKVSLLLRLCSQPSASGATPSSPPSARDAAANILPLIGFIDKSGGQRVDLIAPEVMRQLPLLATDWTQPCAHTEPLERLFEDVFTGLRRVLLNEDVSTQWRKELSGAVGELMTRLVKAVLLMPAAAGPAASGGGAAAAAPSSPLPASCPVQIMLRTLTRSQAFASGAGLPLLPAEAAGLLTWMTENVLPPGGKPPATPLPMGGVPPPGSRAAFAAAAAGDEKLLLLMAQLVRTMLGASGAAVSTSRGGAAADGDAASPRQDKDRALLTILLTWAMGLVRAVMTKLLQPVTGMDSLSSALLAGKQPAAGAGGAGAAAQPPQQTAGAVRAAARLAATAMHGLLLQPVPGVGLAAAPAVAGVLPPGVLPAAARTQLMDVISLLLDMAESCVSLPLSVGPQAAGLDKLLDIAAYILEDCSSLIITAAREAASLSTATAAGAPAANGGSPPKPPPPTASLDVGTIFSRLKAILLAAAALVGQQEHGAAAAANGNGTTTTTSGGAGSGEAGWRRFWAWDVSRPLTASYVRGSRTPGWGAQRLCCNVAEALVCGLAASYHAGVSTYVRALLLLPLSLPGGGGAAAPAPSAPGAPAADVSVGAELSGRGNEALVLSLAMGRLFVLLRGDEDLARSLVPLLTDVLAQPAAGPAVVSLQASVVQTLAAIAAASVLTERSVTWAYTQIVDVLLRLLLEARNPGSAAAALAARAGGPGADALSAGLLKLAQGMRGAPAAARRDLRGRLLVQFSELGLRAGPGPGHESVRAEMGRLLPAIAEACEGLEGAGYCLTASRFSLASLAAQQAAAAAQGAGGRADLQMIRLLRNLWLYVALFGLAGQRQGQQQREKSGSDASPSASEKVGQLAAAGRIAAWTPVLTLGEGAASETDMALQLQAELGERLRLAGDAVAAPARLRAALQSLLGVPLGGSPQPPPDANLQAYLLTVATAELCRAEHAPLRAEDAEAPISVALTYLQAADPLSSEAAWYSLIAKKAFKCYLDRLREAASRAASGSSGPGAGAVDGAAAVAASAAADDDHRRASSYPGGRGPSYAGLSFIARTRNPDGVPTSVAADLAWPGEATDAGGAGGVGGAGSGQPAAAAVAAADAAGSAAAAAAAAAAHVSERCLEVLAVSLIRQLGSAGGHEEGVAPQVATVSGQLLGDLRVAYPPVHWSYPCMEALLSELETEESLDHPLSEVHGANSLASGAAAQASPSLVAPPGSGGSVWRWLRAWVWEAARVAPARTEALLHLFLDESRAARRVHEGGLDGGAGAGLNDGYDDDELDGPLVRQSSSLGVLSAPAGAAAARCRARAAAARRINDLMVVTADARRQSPVGAPGGGGGLAASGTGALCKKQFYSGVIAGVQYTAGGANAGPAAVAELAFSGLEEGLAAAAHNFPLLQQRYLGAAAFLARQAAEDAEEDGATAGVGVGGVGGGGGALAGSVAHVTAYRVLQQLCMAPLKRFKPDMMQLATFAWTWITTAGPGWLVPLVSRTAAAWGHTVDRRLGLFAGDWGKQGGGGGNDGVGVGGSASEWELLKALACHHQWIAFFHEMWASAYDRTAAERRALTTVYDRLLHHSLAAPEEALCAHPAAVAPLFRLLQLALSYIGRQAASGGGAAAPWRAPQALLYDRILRAGLLWFSHPVSYTARISKGEAEEAVAAVAEFVNLLDPWVKAGPPGSAPAAGPVYSPERHGRSGIDPASWSSRPPVSEAVWGPAAKGLKLADAAALLALLCRGELARLREWARPRLGASGTAVAAPPLTAAHVQTAWKVSPQLAVAMVQRFPSPPSGGPSDAFRSLSSLVTAHAADSRVQALPDAAMVLATDDAAARRSPALAALATWAPASAVAGLQLMCGPAQHHAGIKAYALRCLHAAPPAKVVFFLPQLVQALRNDRKRSDHKGGDDTGDGATEEYLLATASRDDKFAHQLMWALATEERPPEEEFNPEVKRSGWEPPKDTGLWGPSAALKRRVLDVMTPAQRAYWEAEDGYFNQVTSISGILKKLEPDARRAKIKSVLATFAPSRPDLYVPTNPNCDVLGHIPESGAPMQSAAKVPILVKFRVAQQQPAPLPPLTRELACIFKVGDDCRQDVLALQVITILRDAFQKAGLEMYLRPYGCIPTGYGRGIIEVVPKSQSRAAMGELAERGLYEIFVSKFGPPDSESFRAAQRNFISSEAGYAVASFLLQAKDRHNGNLLVDDEGHLVHIDFGFILDISPGHNMGFESAAFKMSHEMTQLLDPGGKRNSGTYLRFQELCVRGYLVARTVAEPIMATMALMADSGLPCFGYGRPLANLRKRFHLEMTEAQASAYMRGLIADSYDKWTTGFYDYIQNKQNKIPY